VDNIDYDFSDLISAYKKLDISDSDVILVLTDLRYLGRYYDPRLPSVCEAHYSAILECSRKQSLETTIAVNTSTTYICNTIQVYDPDVAISERGLFTNHVRGLSGAIRSLHPFQSFTALGPKAKNICQKNTRYGFGPNSPMARMLELKTRVLSIGLPPNETATVVHHVEQLMAVPYRYTKEFTHSIKQAGATKQQLFYLFVNYREAKPKKDRNRKLLKNFEKRNGPILQVPVGRGSIFSYDLKALFDSMIEDFSNDIYVALSQPPVIRPYQK
jgi:aminoglycoside 3-N-acetyltransferase